MQKVSVQVICIILLAFLLGAAHFAAAECGGASNDRDGDGSVRADTNEDAPARLQFSEKDLPSRAKDPSGESEIDAVARRRGFNYAAVAHAAARGEPKALQRFFGLAEHVDGAAAESYSGTPTAVFHILGDEKFAKFLHTQPVSFWTMVRSTIASDVAYLRRHFPETTKALFRREMVGWPSPDGRYAIRKVFSDEFDLAGSKVARSELIEKQSGQVLCDMTADDIGTGRDREGEVLWASDSKRVACLSSDLTRAAEDTFLNPGPPQRKHTTVYQIAGEAFARVEISREVPGRENDAEIRGAVFGHEYTSPIRWAKPSVLILERHEYFRRLVPSVHEGIKFEEVRDYGRLYEITVAISPDGQSAATWKLRKDR